MSFDSFSALLHMGGHGLYVWTAFSITVFLIVWLLLKPGFVQRQILREMQRQIQREQAQCDQTRVDD